MSSVFLSVPLQTSVPVNYLAELEESEAKRLD